jgi:hypothetical protein
MNQIYLLVFNIMVFKSSSLKTFPCQSVDKFPSLTRLPLSVLMLSASAALLVHLIVLQRFTSFIGCLLALIGTACIFCPKEATRFLKAIHHWETKHNLNIAPLILSLIGTVYLLDYASTPAAAQFFTQTEGWMRNSFPLNGGGGGGSGSADIYALVFNTLRAIFVLYLAISLVRVIAAARNDEDWQTLARTPLIILITVTLGDILASLITGGAGGKT